jgi:hypothetical protein
MPSGMVFHARAVSCTRGALYRRSATEANGPQPFRLASIRLGTVPVYFSLEIASISIATALMMPGSTLPIFSQVSGDSPGLLRVLLSLLVLLGVSVSLTGDGGTVRGGSPCGG